LGIFNQARISRIGECIQVNIRKTTGFEKINHAYRFRDAVSVTVVRHGPHPGGAVQPMNQNNGSFLCGAGSRIPSFKGLPRMLGNPVGPPRKQKARANQKHKEKPNQYFEECRENMFHVVYVEDEMALPEIFSR
tara:strand:- start:278 stop:679 length:402 start_codon:yes stop_codon:yes gene_type:complete